MSPSLLNLVLRDVKTDVNSYPDDMDVSIIHRERRIAYGALAMCIAIWFILAAIVRFFGGRGGNDVIAESERAQGVAMKDVSSSEATTQASGQILMTQTRDVEKGKGRAE